MTWSWKELEGSLGVIEACSYTTIFRSSLLLRDTEARVIDTDLDPRRPSIKSSRL